MSSSNQKLGNERLAFNLSYDIIPDQSIVTAKIVADLNRPNTNGIFFTDILPPALQSNTEKKEDDTFHYPLMSRIERKYCLISTSYLAGLFDIFRLLHI